MSTIDVEAQSTIGGGEDIFARKLSMKNNETPEFYAMIFARKIIKMPDFYDVCPKNARILHDNCPRNFFTNFFGGMCPLLPPSPTPIMLTVSKQAQRWKWVIFRDPWPMAVTLFHPMRESPIHFVFGSSVGFSGRRIERHYFRLN